MPLTFLVSGFFTSSRFFRDFSFFLWFEINTCSAGLRQSDGNSLFSRLCPMLSLPDIFYLFVYKFPCLGTNGLTLAFVAPRFFNCFFFWHKKFYKCRCN